MTIDYMIHAPDRATFVAVMAALAHPVDGRPLAAEDAETGRLIAHRDVRIDEIGAISKGHWDGEDWIVDATVGGWHVNLRAIGRLAEALGDHDGHLCLSRRHGGDDATGRRSRRNAGRVRYQNHQSNIDFNASPHLGVRV